jgi:hypothetical protein
VTTDLVVSDPSAIDAPHVDELNAEYRAWRETHYGALRHAVRVGEMLHQAKMQLGHGDWKPWLERNFEGSYRSAAVAMQVAAAWASDRAVLENGSADQMPSSIKGALSAIRQAKRGRGSPLHQALHAVQRAAPTTYTLTLDQLVDLARKRWHRPPDEESVLAWLKDQGIA